MTYRHRMDRARLTELLAIDGEAHQSCLREVRRGATFTIPDGAVPAGHLEGIYRIREQHTRQMGMPTVGFAETVDALLSLGEQPVHLGVDQQLHETRPQRFAS